MKFVTHEERMARMDDCGMGVAPTLDGGFAVSWEEEPAISELFETEREASAWGYGFLHGDGHL